MAEVWALGALRMMMQRPTVAIVGSGFSGLLTALRLLTQPNGPNVRLIERRGRFARGAAYSTLDPDHLLNVRASNMSAFPEEPSHFVDWLARSGQADAHNQFVLRSRYGDYLQWMIQKAVEQAQAGRFQLEADEATNLETVGARWRVTLGVGRVYLVDAVVLAVGNLSPATPPSFSPQAAASRAFVADPWSLDQVDLPEEGEALLIGAGLSMVDVALHLARRRPHLKLRAVSRRGFLPCRHLLEGPTAIPRPAPPPGSGVREILTTLKREAAGREWRAVFDGLRPHVHGVWRGWSDQERRRFLRHARPLWDVHRHRLAPEVAARLDALLERGQLTVSAGRIRCAEPSGRGLEVVWTPRRTHAEERLHVALAVNCAGPNGDPAQTRDPLLRGLLSSGLARSDPYRLGLDVDEAGRVVNAQGAPASTLFAVGPVTRGSSWEITSVPDIRLQAALCADHLAQALKAGCAPVAGDLGGGFSLASLRAGRPGPQRSGLGFLGEEAHPGS